MSLPDVLARLPPGSPESLLARQIDGDRLPAHVAIIMDGNGRWAAQRHLPRKRLVGMAGRDPRQQLLKRHVPSPAFARS